MTQGEDTFGASRWGPSDNTPKSEGKGKQKEYIEMGDPSPLADAWSAHPPDASLVRPAPPSPDQLFKKPVLPHINPNARAPPQELTSPILRTSATKPPASSSVLQPAFSLESDLKKEAGELLAKKRAQGGRNSLSFDNASISSTPTSSKPTKRYVGPRGRVALFSAIVQYAHIPSLNHFHPGSLISIS